MRHRLWTHMAPPVKHEPSIEYPLGPLVMPCQLITQPQWRIRRSWEKNSYSQLDFIESGPSSNLCKYIKLIPSKAEGLQVIATNTSRDFKWNHLLVLMVIIAASTMQAVTSAQCYNCFTTVTYGRILSSQYYKMFLRPYIMPAEPSSSINTRIKLHHSQRRTA